MSLKLIRRKGSPYWYARGTVCGQRYTCSTGEANKRNAEAFAAEYETTLRSNSGGGSVTFAYAANAYVEFRQPRNPDAINIPKLIALLGKKLVSEVNQADLVRAASVMVNSGNPATKNRSVIRPAAAILHYAAQNGWCNWMRVKSFKEPEPKTRFVTDAHEEWLLEAVKENPQKRLLIMWLFRQGDRISDILRTKYEDCDLKNLTLKRYISKTERTIILPLDDEICSTLSEWKREGDKSGRIFHWKTHHGVDRWLKRLCKRLEIVFTPHMARHTVGKRLSDSGASLRVIMDKLGHKDSKSSLRYQRGDVESIRSASKLAQKRDRRP